MEARTTRVKTAAGRRRRSVPRAVRIVVGLLVCQALLLAAIGVYPAFVEPLLSYLPAELGGAHSPGGENAASSAIVFVPLGLLALIAVPGFLLLQPAAWVVAMFVQGMSLAGALILYFTAKPGYVYPIMVVGVIMVLYLNYAEVADAFPSRPSQRQGEEAR